jgi:hypothetical protein
MLLMAESTLRDPNPSRSSGTILTLWRPMACWEVDFTPSSLPKRPPEKRFTRSAYP